jgi:2-polyprenyl-3-methyl-5-hydroxy-6-metoxy-1,4-benzoquinol methylase
MKTILVLNCPVCNNKKTAPFLHGKDHFASKEIFIIEKCESCGLLFTQNFPSETDIASYYVSDNYISHSDSRKGFVNKLYHSIRRYMLKSKAKIVEKYHTKKGALLDIGAGTGYFANEIKHRGWMVSAIEKNPQARNFIKQNWNIDAQDSTALFQMPQHSFHVITLWHVLEHIEQLNEMMQRLHFLLHQSGTLVIALPNAASYDAKHYKSFWAAYDVPRHLWHFTPQTFALLASKHNFKIIEIKRMSFDVFYICLLSEKYRGKLFELMRAITVALIGWFLSIFNINNTSSLIYILKKVDDC